ncbi:hypothetical protein DFJ43DRAFT_1036491 [Lentinula guzmanii]|uniref:Uncharacterized protein n=1 Tax=Lentinula guzmanii TaxID=2804957 RepID=A0AA38JTX4_9AGAR|nr:hypothetical protein DFJ43DRAFT_1036491 [Lentinula guzmanii]
MKKRASKRVTVSARVLTSRQGRKEIAAATAKKATKKKANEEKQKRKNDTLLADVLRRAEQDRLEVVFSGNMKNMPKPQLIDIANALKIPHEKATVDVLRVRLNAHFAAHEELKDDRRYSELFKRTRKRKEPPKENDSAALLGITQGFGTRGLKAFGTFLSTQNSNPLHQTLSYFSNFGHQDFPGKIDETFDFVQNISKIFSEVFGTMTSLGKQ